MLVPFTAPHLILLFSSSWFWSFSFPNFFCSQLSPLSASAISAKELHVLVNVCIRVSCQSEEPQLGNCVPFILLYATLSTEISTSVHLPLLKFKFLIIPSCPLSASYHSLTIFLLFPAFITLHAFFNNSTNKSVLSFLRTAVILQVFRFLISFNTIFNTLFLVPTILQQFSSICSTRFIDSSWAAYSSILSRFSYYLSILSGRLVY